MQTIAINHIQYKKIASSLPDTTDFPRQQVNLFKNETVPKRPQAGESENIDIHKVGLQTLRKFRRRKFAFHNLQTGKSVSWHNSHKENNEPLRRIATHSQGWKMVSTCSDIPLRVYIHEQAVLSIERGTVEKFQKWNLKVKPP